MASSLFPPSDTVPLLRLAYHVWALARTLIGAWVCSISIQTSFHNMSKFFGALLLLTIIGTAAACDTEALAKCASEFGDAQVKAVAKYSADFDADAASVFADGKVTDTALSTACEPARAYAACMTGISCYPEMKSLCTEAQKTVESAGYLALDYELQMAVGKGLYPKVEVGCPSTTCDSGSSIAPALGMVSAIFATMLKMLA